MDSVVRNTAQRASVRLPQQMLVPQGFSLALLVHAAEMWSD
jgi:hypothetical protein